jgi:cytochrome c peroxidase
MRKMIICSTVLVFAFSLGIGSAFGLTDIERLGKKIYKDENLSLYNNQSCKTCHHPGAGFADMENRNDPYNSVVSTGSDGFSVGGRNAPTAAYAGFSPVFDWDDTIDGYVGGMFWDGRATGYTLQDPLAEQAQGPFLNQVEMAMTDADAVVAAVAVSNYAWRFMEVFPETDFNNVDETYDNIARAIAAYERSAEVTRFSSKFDEFWRECKKSGINVSEIDTDTDLNSLPQGILSKGQLKGLALFNDPDKGNCAACHVTTDYVDATDVYPPLFTDFTYDNLGIPKSENPLIADNPVDYGLGGRDDIDDELQFGKFKVPTLRNIANTPPYGHNGYFATLENIVRFYNTRNIAEWALPEVGTNVTEELGNLGLTIDEERSIVVFMRSLNDKH